MIDWDKSAKLNNCTIEWLKARFEKYPKSGKKVLRICEGKGCNDERWVAYQDYSPLCNFCSNRTDEIREKRRKGTIRQFSDPKAREAASLAQIKRFSDQSERDAHSVRRIQWLVNHPEFAINMSKLKKQFHIDHPEKRDEMSDRIMQFYDDNPGFYDEYNEDMRGGHDIVNHHMIYDHSDLSKNIMKMTRSMHGKIHALFRKYKIEIPHINTRVD